MIISIFLLLILSFENPNRMENSILMLLIVPISPLLADMIAVA